jgi:hypothetical protein
MYRKHSNWDEDKWDIHSSGGYSSGSSGSGSGYSNLDESHGEKYHKNEIYSSGTGDDKNPMEFYKTNEKDQDNKKGEGTDKEKNIVDKVEQEEKYQKKLDEDKGDNGPENTNPILGKDLIESHLDNVDFKKKDSNTIEEAISKAIKEEREIEHIN